MVTYCYRCGETVQEFGVEVHESCEVDLRKLLALLRKLPPLTEEQAAKYRRAVPYWRDLSTADREEAWMQYVRIRLSSRF